jgi:PAS domain S-box-containing protein
MRVGDASLGRFAELSSVEQTDRDGETRILELIATGRPLADVLDALTRFIESQAEGIYGALAFVDSELRIRPASFPSLPPEYSGKMDGVPVFPYIGPCGMAAYLNQQVISEDISADARWSDEFRSLTRQHGLRAAWSTPILDSRQSVVGIFALYLKRTGRPESHHLKLIDIATRLAGIAIERQLNQDRLRSYEEIVHKSTEAIRISDHNGRIVEQNAAHREMFGIPDAVLKGQTAALIFGEEQWARVWAILTEAGHFRGELVATLNGQPRLIDVSIITVKKEDGSVACRVTRSWDVTEQRKAEESLRKSHAELESQVAQRTLALQNLSQRLLRMQDEERRRVARDLHDSTGQTLVALKMSVAALQDKFTRDQSTFTALSDVAELADRALQEIRTTSYLLHPPLLDEAGFFSAAKWYLEGFAKRSGMHVTFDPPSRVARMPDGIEMALFRILQESLTNVHRHSGSRQVEIQVSVTEDSVVMQIKDFGGGMPAEVIERFRTSRSNIGVGLVGMRERVRELGGQLDVQSSAGGTTIVAQLSLASNDRK